MDRERTRQQWIASSLDLITSVEDWRIQHPIATLTDIEQALDTRLAALRAQMLQDLAMQSAAATWPSDPAMRPACPTCTTPLQQRGRHPRRLRTTGGTLLVLNRPYGVCPQCQHGAFPLDRELGLLPGPFTPSVQAHIVHLGTWLPFARAATVFTTFTQIPISESTVQRLTEAVGVAALALAEADVAHIQAVWPPVPPGPATMIVSVDGAMVPLVGGDWGEVKTLAIGTVPSAPVDPATAPRISDLSYCSRLLDAQEFQPATLGELHRRGMERAGQIVTVNDGASWIQNWIAFHCPNAVRILDFAHAAHRLALIGQAEGPTATPATRAWFTTIQHRLKHLGMTALVAEIEQLAAEHPEAISCREHLAYLTKRVDQMAYPAFQAAGWPIGSGIVESANKLVVEARLKGAGMHWARASVNPMLVLRNAVCNDRWRTVWAASAAHIRQHGRVNRTVTPKHPSVPLPPPALPPPPPAQVQVHPWRRYGQKLSAAAKT